MKHGVKPVIKKSLVKRKKRERDISFEAEFEAAETFFNAEKKARAAPTKMEKTDPNLHSFIQLDNNDIIRLANKKTEGILGEGNFGVVVKGIKRDRSECAIKIEAGMKRSPQDEKVKLMKRIGYHLGETHRKLIRKKKFKGKLTQYKRYTAYTLLRGSELKKQLQNLTQEQKTIVAIKCCEALMALHKKRIIHCDVKPENFIANIEGNSISAKTCDYDFLMMLPPNTDHLELDYWCGTPEYMPPEISKTHQKSIFSFASDIYSLGIMFKKDLELPKNIYTPMLHADRLKRCSLEETHLKLMTTLTNNTLTKFSQLNLDSDTSGQTQDAKQPNKRKRKGIKP